MNSDIYNLLDELAARGRRLRGQLPGDYKPVDPADPMSHALAQVWSLSMSWPAADVVEHRLEDRSV